MIDIAMLSCNRARITETCIREVQARTTTPHRLLVLDNGSKDGSVDVLQALAGEGLIDHLVLGCHNHGVHWGFNRLLGMVRSDPYVCTDNDLIPQAPEDGQDWLGMLVALLERQPDYAAISALPHFLVGDSLSRWLAGAKEVIPRQWAGAALRLMRTAAVRQVRGWRQTTNPSRNNEERYICGRLRSQGWLVGYARDVRCIHLWGETEQGEDAWGYPLGSEHGHREVWPPPDRYNWHRRGVSWERCQ